MWMSGVTPAYPVTGLYSIIYGTLFCFLGKREGEGLHVVPDLQTASVQSKIPPKPFHFTVITFSITLNDWIYESSITVPEPSFPAYMIIIT